MFYCAIKELFWFKDGKKKSAVCNRNDVAGLNNAISTIAANEPATVQNTTLAQLHAEPKIKKSPQFNAEKNHGRRGVDDYTGCDIKHVPHDTLSSNSCCPACAEEGRTLKLSLMKPKKIIILEGKPIISGIRYYCERFRCNLCGECYVSSEEKRLLPQEKYAPSCGSSIVIQRYYAGQPLSRTEMLQRMHGIPLADSTQWDITQKLYDNCIASVFSTLEEHAAQADEHDFDDTSNTVLSLTAANKNAHTTSIIARDGTHTIQLFYTGAAIAKHNMNALIAKRTAFTPLLTMCDASSKNVPELSVNALLFTWVFCLCLVHGRRKFYDIMKHFTVECEFVLETIAAIYKHERHCKRHNVDAIGLQLPTIIIS